MKKFLTVFLAALFATSLAACVGPKKPEDHATWFFEKGEKFIIKSLEKQDVPEASVNEAKKVIDRHRASVVSELTTYIRSEHDLMQAIIGGKSAKDLLEKETILHQRHVSALGAVGKMHEELSNTVGEEKWQAASAQRQEKLRHHLE